MGLNRLVYSFFHNIQFLYRLFEFMSLCWAGIKMPNNVFIQPFNRDHVTLFNQKIMSILVRRFLTFINLLKKIWTKIVLSLFNKTI